MNCRKIFYLSRISQNMNAKFNFHSFAFFHIFPIFPVSVCLHYPKRIFSTEEDEGGEEKKIIQNLKWNIFMLNSKKIMFYIKISFSFIFFFIQIQWEKYAKCEEHFFSFPLLLLLPPTNFEKCRDVQYHLNKFQFPLKMYILLITIGMNFH